MLLRRVIEHVRTQNWTAIILDFVIVVLGVFIGIQVSNWNEANAGQRQLKQQFSAYKNELETNRETLEAYRANAAGQIEAINELRAIFDGKVADGDSERVDTLLFEVIAITDFRPELVAYNDLAASGGLTMIAGTPLRSAVSRWEADLAMIKRLDRDALAHRDGIVLPYIATHASFAAIVENRPQLITRGFTEARHRNDLVFLAKTPQVESMLALRFIIESQIIEASDDLLDSTDALISVLERREPQ